MFEYVDIHSHLYFPDFDIDREEEISKLEAEKIATITIGTNSQTSRTAIALAEEHAHLFACVGEHPADLSGDAAFDSSFEELVRHPKTVAIGECGLDYFRLDGDATTKKEHQKKIFESHIDLALRSDKPLMLHIRSSKGTQDAYLDGLDILEHHVRTAGEKLRGNAHFFAGDMDVLKRFLDIGFTVSFTGVLTFTRDYDELVRYAPLDRLMSETDAPFVAPVPYRGTRNSPRYVPEVVRAIARIREEDETTVQNTLRDTAVTFFKLG